MICNHRMLIMKSDFLDGQVWMLSKASNGDRMVAFSIEVGFGVCYVFEPHFLVVFESSNM